MKKTNRHLGILGRMMLLLRLERPARHGRPTLKTKSTEKGGHLFPLSLPRWDSPSGAKLAARPAQASSRPKASKTAYAFRKELLEIATGLAAAHEAGLIHPIG